MPTQFAGPFDETRTASGASLVLEGFAFYPKGTFANKVKRRSTADPAGDAQLCTASARIGGDFFIAGHQRLAREDFPRRFVPEGPLYHAVLQRMKADNRRSAARLDAVGQGGQ